MGLKGLNLEDHQALNRVFKTPNPKLIGKVRLIKANTGHMAFIDYMMIELFVAAPDHDMFKTWTPEQMEQMKKEVEYREEYLKKEKLANAGNAEKDAVPEKEGIPIPEREGSKEEIAAEDHEAEQASAAEIAGDAEERLVHLCDTCRANFPECPANKDDVEYGDAPGGDNIIKCKEHRLKASLKEGTDGTDVR